MDGTSPRHLAFLLLSHHGNGGNSISSDSRGKDSGGKAFAFDVGKLEKHNIFFGKSESLDSAPLHRNNELDRSWDLPLRREAEEAALLLLLLLRIPES